MFFFFFFNDTATTEIYTLSLHDALPISARGGVRLHQGRAGALDPPSARAGGDVGAARAAAAARARHPHRGGAVRPTGGAWGGGRESTRLKSSHLVNSYAGFCF